MEEILHQLIPLCTRFCTSQAGFLPSTVWGIEGDPPNWLILAPLFKVTGVDIAEQRLAACRTVLRKEREWDGWWDGGVKDVSGVAKHVKDTISL